METWPNSTPSIHCPPLNTHYSPFDIHYSFLCSPSTQLTTHNWILNRATPTIRWEEVHCQPLAIYCCEYRFPWHKKPLRCPMRRLILIIDKWVGTFRNSVPTTHCLLFNTHYSQFDFSIWFSAFKAHTSQLTKLNTQSSDTHCSLGGKYNFNTHFSLIMNYCSYLLTYQIPLRTITTRNVCTDKRCLQLVSIE